MKDQKDRILESKFAGLLVKPVLVSELFFELMKHLKYKSIKPKKIEESVPANKISQEVSDPDGLIHSLENQMKDTCNSFEFIQPIDEVREFGNQLITLGKNHNSIIISEYGEDIVRAADSFNIDVILKLIRKYEDIVQSIREPVMTINNA